VKTIKALLDHGADPHFRDDNGLTPLDGSLGHQNPLIAMRFAACSVVSERSPCVAINT
jgi:ankyrin repeat protein